MGELAKAVLERRGKTSELINLATIQAQNRGYEWAHSNIHQIYELLEHAKGNHLQTQNSRISMTQDSRIAKRSPSGAHYQSCTRTQALSQTNDSL